MMKSHRPKKSKCKSKSGLATKWNCNHCGKEFKYDSERRRHEQSHVRQFECKVCFKTFGFHSALRRHEKQHERTGSVRCTKCDGSFRDEILLKRHMEYAHKGKYSCVQCSSTFQSKMALCIHMKSHQPQSERRYRCSFVDIGCTKTFNFRHHLNHHELTHTNSKQHFCNICDKGFIQLYQLKIHQKLHEPDNMLPCTIPGCKKTFTHEYARKRHQATHKAKSPRGISSASSTMPAKPVKDTVLCVSCGKVISRRFYSKHSLKCNVKEELNTPEDLTVDRQAINLAVSLANNEIKINKSENRVNVEKIEDLNIGNLKNLNYLINDVVVIKGKEDIPIPTCKTVIGGCIVSGNSEINSKCLCAQMTTADGHYDLVPKENSTHVDNAAAVLNTRHTLNGIYNVNSIQNTDGPELVIFTNTMNVITSTCNNNIQSAKVNAKTTMCEGCDCSKTCVIRNRIEDKLMPQIEYCSDGTIKIRETFDSDIEFQIHDQKTESAVLVKVDGKKDPQNLRFARSCKDILGNCIVSGDGTIGEGCLCAKMAVDDQEMTAQEIDDITPCPKN